MDETTYDELIPGQRGSVAGSVALRNALLKQKALAAAQGANQPPAGPGQGQLSPMVPPTQQQAMMQQAQKAAMLRKRAQEEAMMRQQMQPQMPPMNPGGGLPQL